MLSINKEELITRTQALGLDEKKVVIECMPTNLLFEVLSSRLQECERTLAAVEATMCARRK